MVRVLLLSLFLLASAPSSIYDFKVTGLDGKPLDIAKYKGKKMLIVNTASKCGYTPQYADLEKLYEQYKGKLVVIGFPANNFGQQEPGTATEITEFGCMWSTCFAGMNECSGVSIDEARGFRLNVQWG